MSLGVLYEKEDRNYDVSFNGTSLGNLDDHLDYVIGQISIDMIKRFDNFNFSAGLGVNQSISSAFRYRSDLETENIYNSDFTFYDLNLSTSYEFIKDYVVSLRANGMFADERIVPSQRLNYGGLNYGRGYPENTIEGDRGYGTEVKLLQRNKHGNYFLTPISLMTSLIPSESFLPLEQTGSHQQHLVLKLALKQIYMLLLTMLNP